MVKEVGREHVGSDVDAAVRNEKVNRTNGRDDGAVGELDADAGAGWHEGRGKITGAEKEVCGSRVGKGKEESARLFGGGKQGLCRQDCNWFLVRITGHSLRYIPTPSRVPTGNGGGVSGTKFSIGKCARHANILRLHFLARNTIVTGIAVKVAVGSCRGIGSWVFAWEFGFATAAATGAD